MELVPPTTALGLSVDAGKEVTEPTVLVTVGASNVTVKYAVVVVEIGTDTLNEVAATGPVEVTVKVVLYSLLASSAVVSATSPAVTPAGKVAVPFAAIVALRLPAAAVLTLKVTLLTLVLATRACEVEVVNAVGAA